jgi:hypothetical protein
MHPKQAELIERLNVVTASLKTAAPAVLYKYTDDDGNEFWLSVKKTTIKSPYTGKSFSAKPQKASPSAVAKDLKSDEKGKALLFKYTDDDGNEFWLPQKKTTAKSPFTGKSVKSPEKDSISEVAKDLKTDKKAELLRQADEAMVAVKVPSAILNKAKFLGTKAYKDGKKLAPALDEEMGTLLKSVGPGFNFDQTIPLLKAWHAGWTQAMLADDSWMPTESELAHHASTHTAATPVLYKYVDEDGNEFWLKEKKTTAKSPYSGKSVRFETGNKDSISEVQKDLKTDAKKEPKKASEIITSLDALGLE